ncbi:hypothetical protein J3D48_003079 [Pseudomonas fluorescens]|jgi:hypothetical protein|uniref:hypothetical protein n=1 Tax=Pseudomonas fluorescens TaxID=294 RepID=UPI00209E8E84|nr:hypothetical protein [Pseudomonas fluorescens]MCP1486766.1 hypothetical protein [Pseudomonas fluorescens]
MALIECYECKRSISSEASACIHCGAPMAEQIVRAHAQTVAAAEPAPAPAKPSTISFGSLPRNKAVPEAAAPPAPEPLPKVMPAAAGRRRRQPVEQPAPAFQAQTNADGSRPVEGWLKIMIFLLPMVFVWFLLRNGHSMKQRFFGFGWLALLILASTLSPK